MHLSSGLKVMLRYELQVSCWAAGLKQSCEAMSLQESQQPFT